jgi:hypothetical protein
MRYAQSESEFTLSTKDRRACRRSRGTTVNEDLGALHVRGVVGGEEQHRLGDMISLRHPSKRRYARNALLQRGKRGRVGRRAVPDRRGDSSDAITRAMARTPALLAA